MWCVHAYVKPILTVYSLCLAFLLVITDGCSICKWMCTKNRCLGWSYLCAVNLCNKFKVDIWSIYFTRSLNNFQILWYVECVLTPPCVHFETRYSLMLLIYNQEWVICLAKEIILLKEDSLKSCNLIVLSAISATCRHILVIIYVHVSLGSHC